MLTINVIYTDSSLLLHEGKSPYPTIHSSSRGKPSDNNRMMAVTAPADRDQYYSKQIKVLTVPFYERDRSK